MRLQLGIAALVLFGAAAAVHAQDQDTGEGHATSRILVYGDDDATTVVTSIIDAQVTLPRAIAIDAFAVLDAVSSASVDVVSAATGRWKENRVEVGTRADIPVLGFTNSLGLGRSQENDWLSHTVSLGTSREFFQRNTILSANYGFTNNKIGRNMDPNFERGLTVNSAEVAVGQLIDRTTRAGVAYTFQRLVGYQSSPYRYVTATDGSTVPETHPTKRARHALSTFILRSLTPRLSLRAAYRLYRDDWGIWSHTASSRISLEISDHVVAGVSGRFYNQGMADFYRDSYRTSFRYMSNDRELSSFWNLGGNADVALAVGPVTLDARFGLIRYRFRDFSALPKRVALLAGGGAKVDW